MPLPFADDLPQPSLRLSDSITFDPLGVAAVLGNPRADLSAARLYVQSDRSSFRWPHGTMIGGALTPVSTLVSHLAQYESIHPAVTMCTKEEIAIAVISDTVFRELRINVRNLWLRDVLNFRPTREEGSIVGGIVGSSGGRGRAANDIAIVVVRDVFEPGSVPKVAAKEADAQQERELWRLRMGVRWRRAVIDLTGWTTGLLLCTGLTFSVLTGDFWGVALFACYLLHWFASTMISFTYMVRTACPDIQHDDTIKYAVHERPPDIGGTVVFKGTKYEIERWYRTTLQFRHGLVTDLLHWYWIATGSLSAISSVACMVNMSGRFQLVFLGVLFWSSLAELWVTQCARHVERVVRGAAGLGTAIVLTDNKTRTEAITRATLGAGEECNLKGLDWVGLKLLPPIPIFVEYQKLLFRLSESDDADVEKALEDFCQACDYDGIPPKSKVLVDRIMSEVRAVYQEGSREPVVITQSLKS